MMVMCDDVMAPVDVIGLDTVSTLGELISR
jgi:hypothetical protein